MWTVRASVTEHMKKAVPLKDTATGHVRSPCRTGDATSLLMRSGTPNIIDVILGSLTMRWVKCRNYAEPRASVISQSKDAHSRRKINVGVIPGLKTGQSHQPRPKSFPLSHSPALFSSILLSLSLSIPLCSFILKRLLLWRYTKVLTNKPKYSCSGK